MQGAIKKLMPKGFGFIKPDDGGKDVFFHMSKLEGLRFTDLSEGDRVEFEVEDGRDGRPQAIGVTMA